MLDNLDLLTADLLELGALLDEIPEREELEAELREALAGIEPIIEAERARLLDEIDRQRGLIFTDIDGQRQAIMLDVEAQIALVDEQIQGRLEEVFDRVEALTEATLAESFGESERLVNVVYRRVLTLLLVALAGGAGLVLLHKWRHPLARNRRRGESG
jgi:flagellar motility protein MotE (MotC chaperone)